MRKPVSVKDMQPYDPVEACPKCGHHEVMTGYGPAELNSYGEPKYVEHLWRQCERCDYTWYERCLDAK